MPFPSAAGNAALAWTKKARPVEQPIRTDFEMVDGIAVVSWLVEKAGTVMPQHSHSYPHISQLAVGKVRVWKDREFLGEFAAPAQIVIEAHTKHTFETLADHTHILCIHNVSRHGEIEIAEEHQIV